MCVSVTQTTSAPTLLLGDSSMSMGCGLNSSMLLEDSVLIIWNVSYERLLR